MKSGKRPTGFRALREFASRCEPWVKLPRVRWLPALRGNKTHSQIAIEPELVRESARGLLPARDGATTTGRLPFCLFREPSRMPIASGKLTVSRYAIF